jgi:ATP-binding cassette subfamily C (CFTR/MRP) protein 1
MASVGGCQPGVDNQFGPRVNTACRAFDFTLLFENGFFIALPAALFLLLFPLRIRTLWKASGKMSSYKLATWKLVMHRTLHVFTI